MEIEYVVKRELTDNPTAIVGKGHSILNVPVVSISIDQLTSEIKPYDEFKKPSGEGYFRLSSWENGGGQASAGEAEVICGLNGECLKPVLIKRKGDLSCNLHALFVSDGLIIIKASHYRKTFSLEITEYVIINQADGSVRAKTLMKVNVGLVINPDEWIKNELPAPYKEFGAAIKSAMEKAMHFHCRGPHYYIDPYTESEGKIAEPAEPAEEGETNDESRE